MESGMPDEFVFDVIENWKFGINIWEQKNYVMKV